MGSSRLLKAVGRTGDSARVAAAVVVILVLGVGSYAWTLSLGLLGSDTIPIIAESRVEGFDGVVRVLTSPLMGGRNQAVEFYRPVSQALFVLETSLFGLEPLGYQATSLVLHLLCALATFVLARAWTGSIPIAALAACIFVIHPVGVDTVPFPARVQDVLCLLLGLCAFIGHEHVLARGGAARGFLVALLCSLAILTKETGVLFPALIVLSHLLRERGSIWRRLRAAWWIVGFVLSTIGFRLAMLGGPGGYQTDTGGIRLGSLPGRFLSEFFTVQTTPEGFISNFLHLSVGSVMDVTPWALCALLPLLAILKLHALRPQAALGLAWYGGLLGGHLGLRFLGENQTVLLPWHVYLALPAISIILAIVCVRGPTAREGLLGRTLGVAGVGTLLFVLWNSPVVRDHTWLRVGSALQDSYFARLDELLMKRTPDTRSLAPGPMPFFVVPPGGFRGGEMFTAPFTIQAWLDIRHPDVDAVVQDPIARIAGRRSAPSSGGPPRHRLAIETGIEWVMVDGEGNIIDRATSSWVPGNLLDRAAEAADDEELRRLQEQVRQSPHSAGLLLALGTAHLGRGELIEAEMALLSATEVAPEFWQARLVLAKVYLRSGFLRGSQEQLETAARLQPDRPDIKRALKFVRDDLRRREATGSTLGGEPPGSRTGPEGREGRPSSGGSPPPR